MQSSKLGELLAGLTYKEGKRLRKFVRSPYFNESDDLVALLHLLLQQGGEEARPRIWRQLYPESAYDDLKLRHLMSDLMRLVERFLAISEAESEPGLMRVQLLKMLRRKEAHRLYEFTARKQQRKRSRGITLLDGDAFLQAYMLEAEHNTWLEQTAPRSGQSNLQATVNSLDTFYLFSKLKYSCMILNNQNIVDIDYQNLLLEEILTHLEKNAYEDVPAITIYYQIYGMLTQPEADEHYRRLKRLLEAHSMQFTPNEAREMYSFALNYCIGRINKGDISFLREIFELYREVLDRKTLLDKGRLTPWDYKNIVVVGLRLEEFGWVEQFIKQYREMIAPEYRDNAFTYNLAKLHFYRHEYGAVLKLLQQVEYEDVFYNLDSKVMLLKIYFESREVDALDSLIDSFRIFLRRNKVISDHHRTNYLNLIRFVKKLSRLRPGDSRRLKKIRDEVAGTQQLADVNWLRTKLEEAG